MVSYPSQPRSLNPKSLSGRRRSASLPSCLAEIVLFELNALWKWMPRQSKLKSGTWIMIEKKVRVYTSRHPLKV